MKNDTYTIFFSQEYRNVLLPKCKIQGVLQSSQIVSTNIPQMHRSQQQRRTVGAISMQLRTSQITAILPPNHCDAIPEIPADESS